MELERSIDIILSERPVVDGSVEQVVVPLSADESLVAERGLARHLNVLYRGVLKNSNPDRALLAVYDFISDDIDRFRRHAFNLSQALDQEETRLAQPRALAAAAITYLLDGRQSHQTGVWLRGGAREERLIGSFNEIMSSDVFTYSELLEWGFKQSIRNRIYWRQQLEQNRNHPLAVQLKNAIKESDHQVIEV